MHGLLSPVEGLLYETSGTANSTLALCCHPEPAHSHYNVQKPNAEEEESPSELSESML
jgi:hypothetical protein